MSSYTIPSVVEKTLRGERAVDIYSRLLSDRIVYVGTEIDDGVANVVIAQHTGQSVERLCEDTERDLILTAAEAVAYGLADQVLDSRKATGVQRGA